MRILLPLFNTLFVALFGIILFAGESCAAQDGNQFIAKSYDVRKLIPGGFTDTLSELCVDLIAPESWDDVGGEGEISFVGQKMMVRQTPKAHALISSLLVSLRKIPPLGNNKAKAAPKKTQISVGSQTDSQGKKMQIVVYSIGDLLRGGKNFVDFDSIVEKLTSTVDPPSWDESGGTGSIGMFEHRGVLVISNTPKAHKEIAQVFAKMRSANGRKKRR